VEALEPMVSGTWRNAELPDVRRQRAKDCKIGRKRENERGGRAASTGRKKVRTEEQMMVRLLRGGIILAVI